MNDTVPTPISPDRLTFTPDGHADPEQLADLMTDADTRTQSTGLTYLAAHTPVPATFQASPEARHESNTWCVRTGAHNECQGREIGLPVQSGTGLTALTAYIDYDADDDETFLVYGLADDAFRRFLSGQQLRAETAKVRAHLIRLDALADEYDAIREAAVADRRQTALANTAAALARIDGYRQPGDDANVTAWWDEISDLVKSSGDPAGVFAQITGILRAEKDRRTASSTLAGIRTDAERGSEWMAERDQRSREAAEPHAEATGSRGAHVPPGEWDTAEAIRTAGASGAILKAYLYTPREIDGEPTGPQCLAVYSESGTDDELDLAGALDLREQVAALLPNLDAMISILAANEADRHSGGTH